jgi:cyclin B
MTNAFYRFIGILDRFLSIQQVTKQNLRVIGGAALLIASKIEDVRPADAGDIIEINDYSIGQKELVATELQILNVIEFDTAFPTPLFHLTHLMRISGGETTESVLFSRYVLETLQTCESFFGMEICLMACVAVMVTRILYEMPKWSKELEDYTAYKEADVDPWTKIIYRVLNDPNREESKFISRKYGSELFMEVASLKIPKLI